MVTRILVFQINYFYYIPGNCFLCLIIYYITVSINFLSRTIVQHPFRNSINQPCSRYDLLGRVSKQKNKKSKKKKCQKKKNPKKNNKHQLTYKPIVNNAAANPAII